MLKRLFDIVFSLLFIIVFSWLYLLISILILLTSGMPIFYSSKRVCQNEKTFMCIKFRSMNKNKEIYKFGNFLRKSNLDEIPQFFNVFLGSMSVVGPRPHDFDEDIFFNSQISNYKMRYHVKPGITGLAGINGNRGGTDLTIIKERVDFDILYIKNQSLIYDLKIVLITIFLTLTGKKSI